MKDVEAALQRLDQLTQEEARMAAAEALMITRGIDDGVKDVNEMVHNVNVKVEGVDCKVQGVDDRVKGVDLKVGSVIKGKLYLHYLAPNLSSTFTWLGVNETGVAIQEVVNQVSHLNRS